MRVLLIAAFGLGCSQASNASPLSRAELSFSDEPYKVVASAPSGWTVAAFSAPSQPPPKGVSVWKLVIKNADGALIDNASIKVTPLMPSHGHGTPTTPSVNIEKEGTYRVDSVDLFMSGRWELRLRIETSDASEAATINVDIP